MAGCRTEGGEDGLSIELSCNDGTQNKIRQLKIISVTSLQKTHRTIVRDFEPTISNMAKASRSLNHRAVGPQQRNDLKPDF